MNGQPRRQIARGDRHGHCSVCHAERWQLPGTSGNCKRHDVRLARYQRSRTRKRKWLPTRRRPSPVHAHIGNRRQDFLHKATATISQSNAMVCIEDLHVKNMSRSLAASIKVLGRGVQVKSGLKKAKLDQGWFEFRKELDCKLARGGGVLVTASPQCTNQACHKGGDVSPDNRKRQSVFVGNCLSQIHQFQG